MDKFGFKILTFIICSFELGVSATIYYFADNPYVFVIENMLIALSLSGSTMLIPLFHKIFGKDFGAELYGLTGIFIGLASLIGPFLIKLIVKDVEDYLTVYYIGVGLSLIKTIALICFKENKPYIFENGQINEDKNALSISIPRDSEIKE